VLLELAKVRQAAIAASVASAPTEPAEAAERSAADRGVALEAVLLEILADPEAAFRSVAVLYQDFLVRCRTHGLNGRLLELPAFRRKLTSLRAGIAAETAEGPEWQRATAVAGDLPEDIQGVFLLLARAAVEGAPCPSDVEVARACGSRSRGRARRLLAYLEQRGLIAIRAEVEGRVIAMPDIEAETAPGDPDAEDEEVSDVA
jgi:hypothetical protein